MSDTPFASTATRAVAATRVVVGLGVIAVVVYAYVEGIAQGRTNPFDYFGYFTNLTSLLISGVLVVAGSRTLRGLGAGAGLAEARGALTACMLVVAVIYNGLVPGTGAAPPWVSAVLHLAFPCYAMLDWLLVGDRPRLPWGRLWIVLPYPVLWLSVVLVRGATDGWVPYGFLLPERGLPSLLAHIAGLILVLLLAGAGAWGASRFPGARGTIRKRRIPATSE